MRQFATYYPDFEIMPQAVAQLPWGHISVLIHKIKDDSIRCWYAEQAIEQGWSRLTLELYLKKDFYQHQAISSTKSSNYLARLPSPQSMNEKNIFHDTATKIHFESVKISHKDIILAWFNEDHVKEFYYGEGLQNTLRNLELYCQGINDNGRYTFYHWIAFYNEIPLGFLMTSPITGPYDQNDDYNKWYIDGKQTVTLDLLIGEKEFLGKGLAHTMIQKFILDQYSDVNFFILDPEASNTKAIHVYEKAGFKKVGELCPAFNPKPHIMMRIDVEELKNEIKSTVK